MDILASNDLMSDVALGEGGHLPAQPVAVLYGDRQRFVR